MNTLYIPVVLGTSRKGRHTEYVARFVAEQARKYGFNSPLVDVDCIVTHRNECDDPEQQNWNEIAAAADGFIIVSPEYNHSFPGELKMLIDKAEEEYAKKVMGIVGVSSGGLGGARMVEHLVVVARALSMTVTKESVYFSRVKKAHDGKALTPETIETYAPRLEKLFAEVEWYAKTLKAGRENA